MGQSRNKTGVLFEHTICQANGWTRVSKSPKISWSGVGRNNFERIVSVNFDATKFVPTSKSTFEKYDAITEKGERVEIKKYKSVDLKNWKVYSEPIFKIADRKNVALVTKLFGQGSLEKAIEKYNLFVFDITKTVGQDIIDRITESNIGIQLEDGFIPHSKIEYRWSIKKGWSGFDRLSIEFRIK